MGHILPKQIAQQVVFFVNPNAGSKRYEQLLQKAKKQVPTADVVLCSTAAELDEAFATYLPTKKYFVVAGGDGTVHQAAKHVLNARGKVLAIYPNGSGNGFARELGFNQKMKKLLRAIKRNATQKVDVLSLNGHTCVNVAGFGIDGAVAHAFAGSKRRGLMTYAVLTVKTLLRFKPFAVALEINGQTISGNLMLLSVANTRQFGNNAIISPSAKFNDGKLNITTLSPFPIWLFPGMVMQLFKGTLKESRYVKFYVTKNPIKITALGAPQHIDGEARELGDEVIITVLKKSLTVLKV